MINHHDWKIHKILQEFKDDQRKQRLMLMMGRGNGKTRLLEEELDYVLSRPKPEPVKFEKSDIIKLKETVIDWDLFSDYGLPELQKHFEEHWQNEMLKYIRKDIENWRPRVYMDTSLIKPSDWYNKQLTVMDSVLGSFIVASEEE